MNTICEPREAPTANRQAKWLTTLKENAKCYWQRRMDREAFRYLSKLDDSLLDDIGVTRADVEWAMNLPLSQDASDALQRIARGCVKR